MRHQLQIAGKARKVQVSSAGTHASRPGASPDRRVENVLKARGVKLGRIRARRLTAKELQQSDHVFAMDRQNLQKILDICDSGHQHKVSLLLPHISVGGADEVPDPYYGSYQGFVDVRDMIDVAVLALITSGICFS